MARDDVRAIKTDALLANAKKIIGAAGNAARIKDWNQTQTKLLQAFIILDLCWKIAGGSGTEHDEQSALLTFHALSERFNQRMIQTLAAPLPNDPPAMRDLDHQFNG